MKLSTHTRFWSVILFLSIVVLSLGLYVAYMWVSDTSFSIYVQHSMLISYTTGNVYLVVIFCCCLVVCIDGYVVTVDFNRSRYASKMRIIIDAEKEESRSIYQ